ncbi:MAG: class I SAM-dependent methyltransferase [Candidatus Scalindua sp.]|jgi:ubiquinone/menaquinone biosynthesis C-methylase UbiE|nr:class I SAM-dependent methyltransferase [Candidatus Scalindua sp.]MBT5304663.1 class I SAM-dependent methyltransferase [Candidatus Scalindua sp.]MBT6048811.1 class I SAM-dependent methyltransferase [Candidatus Scalindua sp.]MBT6229381.1 class I SAM-dependent methyltransferase [Candidatus Scalindua sp.]MBT6563111.1 class I SAM-dependent methyltransferase [Candidatus Scalindua sp.]
MNKKKYESKSVVSSYINMRLQNPEVMILVKYREAIAGKHVLDIGCGSGRTTAILKNLSNGYVGIDYSLDMIESCRKRFKDVCFLHGDVRDMNKFKNEEFDYVMFSFNGLDSINHEDRLKGLMEIRRILKKEGLFVFSSHNRNHRYAISRPEMEFSMRPCRQVENFTKFIKSMCNHLKNRNHQVFNKRYAILNDVAHNYAMLTYYIDKVNQVKQLEDMGFKTIEMYDTLGNILDLDSDDKDSAWIYYVAKIFDQKDDK